jgi:hypothetical protein
MNTRSEVRTADLRQRATFRAKARQAVTKKLKERLAEIEAWRELGLSTDFPAS